MQANQHLSSKALFKNLSQLFQTRCEMRVYNIKCLPSVVLWKASLIVTGFHSFEEL